MQFFAITGSQAQFRKPWEFLKLFQGLCQVKFNNNKILFVLFILPFVAGV